MHERTCCLYASMNTKKREGLRGEERGGEGKRGRKAEGKERDRHTCVGESFLLCAFMRSCMHVRACV